MPSATHTHTTPEARQQSVMHVTPPAIEAGDPVTIAGCASMEWEPLPAQIVADLGTREAWMEEVKDHWNMLLLGVNALTFGPEATAAKAAADEETFIKFYEGLAASAKRFHDLGTLLDTVSARIIGGLCRAAVSKGESEL